MKHILIILSIILLSSPVIGQETGVLYQYETSSGFVWKINGDKNVQPIYKGEITGGKLDGFGVLIFPYGGKNVVGEWKNGKEWNTKHSKKDGTLLGKFENGKWNIGTGILYYSYDKDSDPVWDWRKEGNEEKNIKYKGEIVNGRPNGKGSRNYIKYLTKGSKYIGDWKDGKQHGQGTFIYSDGKKYTGEWKDGEFWNGKGVKFKHTHREIFFGEWKDGKLHGQGKILFGDGAMWIGKFKDGKLWNGQYFKKDGSKGSKTVNGEFISKK